jgi:DNA-binding winged helix-turn-helix (wHTH) protein/tetratricopeptide (TPR) repeat protein
VTPPSQKSTARKGAEAGQRRWLFGPAVLDESALELRVDGRLAPLERKPLEVLIHLLHHAGEVVTKDELIAALWPGRIVTETVLAKAVGKLRSALADDAQALIKTVHGYGYRLATKVEIVQGQSRGGPHFAFKPGDHPPGRPRWSLVKRLGTGGQGEAWLASHDKTREQRVFKFAIDQLSLGALKREITLFRFLNDSLGEQARIVALRDWNLEQSPCFLEADYVAGGSLTEWAERNGGLAAIPLPTRVDVAAQIAEALAAVHSVGVLHKDLKPSNVLIQSRAVSEPLVLLADFGSGGVLDARRLAALGITRLGFTKSMVLGGGGAGTPMYLAPELLAGQPPTVKGDVYALGVMLYQLVVGEFRRAMSAGWEREVHDELLREIIAEAAQGDVAHRLGDAASLAHRLRALDEERERRRVERAERLRTQEIQQALALAKSSQAVAEFLSRDMFAVVGTRPLRDLTVRELLQAASGKLADRFQDMPLAAAQIHAALGSAFWTMESMEEAMAHLDAALTGFEELDMGGSDLALPVAAQLMTVEFTLGKRLTTLDRYQQILDQGRKASGARHPGVLALRQQMAWMRFCNGEWQRAARELQQVLTDAGDNPVAVSQDTVRMQLGRVLTELEDYPAALSVLKDAHAQLTARHGEKHVTAAHVQALLGVLFARLGRFDEAEAELGRAEALLAEWTEHDSAALLVSVRYGRGQLRLAQGRSAEAIEILEYVLRAVEPLAWMKRSGLIGELQTWLAKAYRAAGRLEDAATTMRTALAVSESTCGSAHPQAQVARLGLAGIVLQQQCPDEARELIASIDRHALAALVGEQHPLVLELAHLEDAVAPAVSRPGRAPVAESGRRLR